MVLPLGLFGRVMAYGSSEERLYAPTSQIGPNDADPGETSLEGGSNVAKVVGAQKDNDKAAIILDDGSVRQSTTE